jgi:hypothetical protein
MGAFAEQHTEQINVYAEKWREISGDEVVEKGAWLVDKNEWREVNNLPV